MVDPITALTIGSAATKALGGIIGGSRAADAARLRTEAVVENIEDQIRFTKIIAARKNAKILGSGRVAAAASGVQFSGSFSEATGEAVFENQFETAMKLHDLQFRKRLAAFDGAGAEFAAQSQIAGAAIGGVSDAISIGQIARREGILRDLLKK